MDTPTLRELLSEGSFYVSVAVVYAAMLTFIALVYILVRRRRRRRRSHRDYYGPRGPKSSDRSKTS